MEDFARLVLDLIVYVIVGGIASWVYYGYKKKALIGGFFGGAFIATVGAIVVTLLSTIYDWFSNLVIWLMIPKINGEFYFRVNLITATLGALLFVSILNRINQKRDRH